MGYSGKLNEKFQAQELRRKGLSYREILLHISVSKDTLSRWLRDIELTQKQKQRLLKIGALGQRKGSLIAADNKRKLRLEKTKTIFIEAKSELGKLNKRERFIAGIAFYSGEGDKSGNGVGFANTDPQIIKFMMKWFREFCHVPISKFRGALWLHEGLSDEEAKKFWSNLTGIPINQFHKTYIAQVKSDSRKIRKNIHQHGVFSIRFSDSDKHRRILGWILALLGGKIKLVH